MSTLCKIHFLLHSTRTQGETYFLTFWLMVEETVGFKDFVN